MQVQAFEVVFLFVIAFGVMTISALASGRKGWATIMFVAAVTCWGAYLSMIPA